MSVNANKQDLESIVDGSSLTRQQLLIVGLCALVAMIDGFNTQSIALVAPAIIAAWRVPAASFGLVFGAGLFGSLIGALAFGVLADRRGRKPVLVAAVALFGVINLLTPFTHSVAELTVIRLITGFGLGGALPITLSLSSEYAPKRLRTTLVALMFCGFPLGAVVGGIASTRLIPAFGWASVFYLGGIIPMLLLPLIGALLPESARFLSMRQDRAGIERVLARMGWAARWDGQLVPQGTRMRSPVANLFTEGRAAATLLLWATLFLSLLLTYFLINWIPVIARQSGIGMSSAVLAVSALNLGAIVGCLAIGRLADRFGQLTTLVGLGFAIGALAIALIGFAHQSGGWLLASSFLAGVCSIGAQMCTVVYCATFYATSLRATGVGWAIGVGRIGSIVGPVLGGVLLGAGVPTATLLSIIGVMSLGSGAAILTMGWLANRRRRMVLA